MKEQFVSASIRPVAETMETTGMEIGGPALAREFRWGTQIIQIAQVLKTWRETGACRHGSGERYVRKHWFEVLTGSGETMKIYFERQGRPGKTRDRWRLFTIEREENGRGGEI